jgi:predicted ester cyclase
MPSSLDEMARRWFKDVWDEGKEDVIDEMLAPDCVVHGLTGPGGPDMIGAVQFKPLFHMFREALGDLTIDVERTIVQGDVCAAYCRVRGKHVGRALGGEPTNQPVDFRGVTIFRVSDGKLVEGWNVFDFLSMYQQIGWVQSPVVPA